MKKKKKSTTTTTTKDEPMSVLSMQQIAQFAANAGFVGSDLATAVAIAMVESSGDPQAQNPHEPSFGLWQIDIDFHPQFSAQQLLDPATNAQAAHLIYLESGGSFRQWTGSYTNGKYLAFLPQATAVVLALFPPTIIPEPTIIPPEPSSSDITNGTTPQTDGGTVATAPPGSGAILALVIGGLAWAFLRR